ncbi:1,4-alpha-glucan branching protein GlgB [Clostridium sp. AF15-6B]|jgi:1,4-alpha-glucan branching enzyme|nr:1,4-alpha-glucan branching protein GlgB [Clostridium sp. AF16-25]RGH03915.1 1,4-alpha-glucan branching protein GlgB [Clostridium sp. AF15-49]RGH07401.1 1,4-alpha-glucan branching protein GlgB [Clostridium sp. AF15-6B]
MNKRLEDWVNWILIDELKNGIINAPKHLLGNHDYGDGQVIMVYRPHAEKVCVVSPTGKNRDEMECLSDGVYGFYSAKKKYKGTKYRIETTYQDGTTVVTADAYAFNSQITDFDTYLFAEGKHYDVYEKFGAHPMTIDGVKGTYFAVWAPHARRVSVVGDFNMWDGALNPMQMMQTSGIYELFIPDVAPGAVYKYQILTRDGEILYKADPYGNQCQVRPDNANVVADLTGYKWKDTDWIENRKQQTRETELKKPMAIYECHLGSWKKKIEDSDFGFYTYRELAKMLCDYVKKMGYTHVELMGIAEYPFDGSWGYQVTNYYAPTSRYGSPEDFMYFVDHMHENGIGVILDWVPAHFPRDEHGLGRFDGMPLYEHPDPRRGEHPDWGTYIFDFGRNEVSNFLTANALFWVEKFHVDALRVDAVASMLYLDYGKQDGQWLPNKDGGNENYDAIELLRKINTVMEERNPGAFLIAEESTAWAGVTAPASMKGLGFLYKWNMGWMNDFLEYMKMDPYFRSFNHNRLTFSLSYTYAENYVLVISHDEVVHLKCSMLNKMPGVEMDKFANLRTAYGFMYGHPGKKLLFMGQEFGQLREWSEARSLDWFLLDQPLHKKMQKWVADLNHMYTTYDACYYNDNNQMGFEWTKVDDANTSIIAFVRRGKTVKDQLLFVCNFVPVERKDYWIGVPCLTEYEEIINSDAKIYGGSGTKNGKVKAFEEKCDRMPYAISIDIAPLSMMVFRYDYVDKKQAVVDAPATAAIEKKPEPKKATTAKKSTAAKKPTAKKAAVARTSTENKSVEKKTTK